MQHIPARYYQSTNCFFVSRLQDRFKILDRIFSGERAFIFSATWTELMYENYYRATHGSVGFPLTRLKDRQRIAKCLLLDSIIYKNIPSINRFSYVHQPFCVKKYLPQTQEIYSVLGRLKSSGIAIHEHLKYDFYRGKKEVRRHFCVRSKYSLLTVLCLTG